MLGGAVWACSSRSSLATRAGHRTAQLVVLSTTLLQQQLQASPLIQNGCTLDLRTGRSTIVKISEGAGNVMRDISPVQAWGLGVGWAWHARSSYGCPSLAAAADGSTTGQLSGQPKQSAG